MSSALGDSDPPAGPLGSRGLGRGSPLSARAPHHASSARLPTLELLASIADALPAIVFMTSPDASLEHVSERFVEYTGMPVEAALEHRYRNVVHPDDLARAEREIAAPILRGEACRFDARLRDRRGTYRWHDIRAAPVRKGGVILRWLGTCTDIDERRRAERLLTIAGEMARAMGAEPAPNGDSLAQFASAVVVRLADFCAVDVLEGAHLRRAAVALASVIGSVPTPLMSAASRAHTEALAVRADPLAVRYAPEALRKLAPTSVLVLPLRVGSQHRGYVWFATLGIAQALAPDDVALAGDLVGRVGSSLHHAELYEAAQRGSRDRDEFLAVVSHELRTPLSTILGWARLLQGDASDPKRLEHGLAVIERSASSQSRIIDDLLDVSRAVSGKLRLDPQDVSMRALALDAVEATRPAARDKALTLTLDAPDVSIVHVDPERVRQVLWNLLQNAVKFTPSGGSITVRVRGELHAVYVGVEDTGAGVDPAFLPFVFDSFRQADGSATRLHDGLGLGLALVRAIVELHAGTAGADSAGLGLGACFWVRLPIGKRLPRVAAPERTSDVPVVASTELVGVRVLVVDDARDALELAATVLRLHGARVSTASSAAEALGILETQSVEILVSDIGMAEADGCSLARRALAAHPGLRAVALSAYARPDDQRRALAAGFARYVTKPFDPARLVATVAALARAAR